MGMAGIPDYRDFFYVIIFLLCFLSRVLWPVRSVGFNTCFAGNSVILMGCTHADIDCPILKSYYSAVRTQGEEYKRLE